MRDPRRIAGIVGISACIAVAVVIALPKSPAVTEIDVGETLPANYYSGKLATSYWPDAQHIICCFQGFDPTQKPSRFLRRSFIYELPSGNNWRLSTLEPGTSPNDIGGEWTWDFAGLSKDRKRLLVSSSGAWYTTQAFPAQFEPAGSLNWIHIAAAQIDPQTSPGSAHEIAGQTPGNIPTIDQFTGKDSRSVSPDGHRIAWIVSNDVTERFHRIRDLLRQYHILSEQPPYSIWVADTSGKHAYRLANIGGGVMHGYDLRWSPDAKHISCLNVSIVPAAPPSNHMSQHARSEFRLTIYDVNR